jgi:heme/copper-type cytochrome/quinol oxidase subunit 2
MGADRELWPDEYTVFNILYDKFLFWSILVGLFTFAWLLIAILRYREGVDENIDSMVKSDEEKLVVGTFPKERHNFDLELAWFVGPTILVVWVTILAFGSMNIVWGEVQKLQESDDAFTVEVNGIQWYWDFYYQDALTWEDVDTGHNVTWNSISGLSIDAGPGGSTAAINYGSNSANLDLANNTTMDILFNELIFQSVDILDAEGNVLHRWQHIPVEHKLSGNLIIPCDTNVMFNIHSNNPIRDSEFNESNIYQGVQHAFWLQEWGMKEDAVPGLEGGTWMYVQPNEPGVFPIRCAEYCGQQHSVMAGQVEVVAKEGTNCDADFGVYFDNGGVLV